MNRVQLAAWRLHDVDIDYNSGQLGTGAYGKVFTATWKGTQVAAKILHQIFFNPSVVPADISDKMFDDFLAECGLLADLRHPNIVQLYGVYMPDDPLAPLVMVAELLPETLRARIHRSPTLTLYDVLQHSLEISTALRFLHERREPIAHRDLSSTNIMVSDGGVCKLVDLGLAKIFTQAARLSRTMKPGHEHYMPGEVLSALACYDERIDVFSLGVVMLEMLTRHDPQPQGQWLVNTGGQFRLVPEVERREGDLAEIGNDHPLYGIIMRTLEPHSSRPLIREVHEQLTRLQHSDMIPQRLAIELQAAQQVAERHQTAQQSATERELDDLRTQVTSLGEQLQSVQMQSLRETAQPGAVREAPGNYGAGRNQILQQLQQSQLDLQRQLLESQQQVTQMWQMHQMQMEMNQQMRQQMQQQIQSFQEQQRQQLSTFRQDVLTSFEIQMRQVETRLMADRQEFQRRTTELIAEVRSLLAQRQ